MRYILVALVTLLSACSSPPEPVKSRYAEAGSLHQYAMDLTVQLTHLDRSFASGSNIAVTSFYYVDSLGQALAADQGAGLSQQLQESIITQLTQLGYRTVEFRLQQDLQLGQAGDSMMSRDISSLKQRQNIDLVVVGTLTQREEGYIANARLVRVSDGRVLSAATREMPRELMWSNDKVQRRDGRLYRASY